MTKSEAISQCVPQTSNTASEAVAILITIAILHIVFMELSDIYRNFWKRKLRTIQRRIQLTEHDR